MSIMALLRIILRFLRALVLLLQPRPPVADDATGSKNILVLLVKFPDVEPSVSVADLEEKYFNKLPDYVSDVSYGRTSVQGETRGWYTLPDEVEWYKISPHNTKVEKERVEKLIQDAIDLADVEVTYSDYSLVFISLGAGREDYGMMGLCGYPGMLGWERTEPFRTRSGQEIPGGIAIYCENAHVGVVFHDLAHILGGVEDGRRLLPCLYDHQLQSQEGEFRGYAQFYLIYLGYFDPMSCHYYQTEIGPPGLVSWCKLRLGWLDYSRVGHVRRNQNREFEIVPLSAQESESIAAVKVHLDENTYYLVENRQPIGADQHLPGTGVLILYCNETIEECTEGDSPVKLMNAHPDIAELKGAAFNTGPGEVDTYTDLDRGLEIKLLEKVGDNYRVSVTWIQ